MPEYIDRSRLLRVVVGFFASVFLAEVLARSFGMPKPVAPSSPRELPEGLPIIRTIHEQSWPNAEGIHRNAYFRNNSDGFRGPEVAEQAAPGTYRIAVFGDSIPLGSGVGNDESYPAVLQSLLRERYPTARIEVLNFGLGGINTRQARARAAQYVPRYRPDLVVYGLTLDDVKGEHYVQSVDPQRWRAQKADYLRFDRSRSRLLRLLWPQMLSLRAALAPPRGSYVAEVRYNFFANPLAWSQFESAFRGLVELCHGAGARVVVFTHTRLWFLNRFHPFRPMYDKYAATAAALGAPTIHSFSALRGYRGQDLWVSTVDPHPNAAAHEILAKALADGLEALPERYFEPDR